MKNLYIIHTDKSSKLFIDTENDELVFTNIGVQNFMNQHLYIISDEEIKEGDWVLFESSNIIRKSTDSTFVVGVNNIRVHGSAGRKVYKIILTTDEELIADGIQVIDDEFLQWFVKNPSCVEVKIRKNPKVKAIVKDLGVKSFNNGYRIIKPKSELARKLKELLDGMSQEEFDEEWKKVTDLKLEGPSIIPKDETEHLLSQETNKERLLQDVEKNLEQKQHLIDMMKGDEELGLYEETTKCYYHTKYCDCGPEDTKQESVYTEQEVKDLLEMQRGNCYVALLTHTKSDDIASIALDSPEPGGRNGTWVKQ